MGIKLKATSGGTLNVNPADTASEYTLTLPAQTGTVLTTASTPSFATTIGVGNATPSGSGAGISFPATQSASSDANTLDDYEEGTWTPTIYGDSSAGSTSYNNQSGIYTKIGRVVTVGAVVDINSATGSGYLRIGGFPFAGASNNISNTVPMISNLNWGGGSFIAIDFPSNQTAAYVYYCADDASQTIQNIVNEAMKFTFTITYITS